MHMRRLDPDRGFTLTELLVAAFLSAAIGVGLLASFIVGRTSFLSANVGMRIQEQARQAFDNVVRELREAGKVSTTSLPNGAIQLNFQIARGYNQSGCLNAICWGSEQALDEWVHYSIVGNAGNDRQLIRCRNPNELGAVTALGTGCRVLANHVRHPNGAGTDAFIWDQSNMVLTVHLEVEYQDSTLPTGSRTTGVLTSRVRLRNPAS